MKEELYLEKKQLNKKNKKGEFIMIIENGALYSICDKDIVDGKFEVPNNVTCISRWAFEDCTSLTEIAIPDSVTYIGDYAFEGCTSLTEVIIPDSVILIERGAFEGCSSLTKITIPDSVAVIGWCAFLDCTSLNQKQGKYKAFKITEDNKLECRNNFIFEENKPYHQDGEIFSCDDHGNGNGFHYCTRISDVFNYYCDEYDKDFVIYEIESWGEESKHNSDSKVACSDIKLVKRLSKSEVFSILSGKSNDMKKERIV